MEDDGFVLVRSKRSARQHNEQQQQNKISKENKMTQTLVPSDRIQVQSQNAPNDSTNRDHQVDDQISKRAKKGRRNKLRARGEPTELDHQSLVDTALKAIKEKQIRLLESKYCNDILQALEKIRVLHSWDITCLGIGSITSSSIAQHQLALMLILIDKFKPANPNIYDPIFTDSDRKILQTLNLTIPLQNERGNIKISSNTIFYMPHCGDMLYSNILESNWSMQQLEKLVIIGNSFSTYSNLPQQQKLQDQSPYLVRIIPATTETPFPPQPYLTGDIFNNTSIHSFDATWLSTVPLDFWEKIEKTSGTLASSAEVI